MATPTPNPDLLHRIQLTVNTLAREAAGMDAREAARVAKQLSVMRDALATWRVQLGGKDGSGKHASGKHAIPGSSTSMLDQLVASIDGVLAKLHARGGQGSSTDADRHRYKPSLDIPHGGLTTEKTIAEVEHDLTIEEAEAEEAARRHEEAEERQREEERRRHHGGGASGLPSTDSGGSSDLAQRLFGGFWHWSPPAKPRTPTIIDPGPDRPGSKPGHHGIPVPVSPADAPVPVRHRELSPEERAAAEAALHSTVHCQDCGSATSPPAPPLPLNGAKLAPLAVPAGGLRLSGGAALIIRGTGKARKIGLRAKSGRVHWYAAGAQVLGDATGHLFIRQRGAAPIQVGSVAGSKPAGH